MQFSTKFPLKLIDGNDPTNTREFKGVSGTKGAIKVRLEVAEEKDAAAAISYLNSPTFRAELDAAKGELGLNQYGMDVGRVYPLVKELENGGRQVIAYVREIKLTRSI